MSPDHSLISGNRFIDQRGSVSFVNDFDLKSVVRFYEIAPKDTSVIRAWQAHKKESKWFYCTSGKFLVNLVKIDNFDDPSEALQVQTIELNSDEPKVLYIPGGFANGFKAIENNSKLMVFSNFDLEASKNDDYRFDSHKWVTKW